MASCGNTLDGVRRLLEGKWILQPLKLPQITRDNMMMIERFVLDAHRRLLIESSSGRKNQVWLFNRHLQFIGQRDLEDLCIAPDGQTLVGVANGDQRDEHGITWHRTVQMYTPGEKEDYRLVKSVDLSLPIAPKEDCHLVGMDKNNNLYAFVSFSGNYKKDRSRLIRISPAGKVIGTFFVGHALNANHYVLYPRWRITANGDAYLAIGTEKRYEILRFSFAPSASH
jgi:hypothetical protein